MELRGERRARHTPAVAAVLLAGLLSGPAAGQEVAAFELTLDITWSAETAPLEFPENAHMSRLIGATHNDRYVLFRDGHTASSGLELVAENGRTSVLKAELAEAERRGRAGGLVEGPNLARVPGEIRARFEARAEHPLVSFVTMIAPSPDWFTGAADVALMTRGRWVEEVVVPLWAWDGGTDGGETYEAANQDTQPRQSVRLLATAHFLGAQGLVAVGSATIRRVER